MKKNNDEFIIKIILGIIAVMVVVGGIALLKNNDRTVAEDDDDGYDEFAVQEEEKNIHNDYSLPAEIEPVQLPEDPEATIGFAPKQLDRLSDHYVLAKYEMAQDSIIYYYQSAETTSGERFMVICTKMSKDDYLNSIPTKNVKTENYKDIDLTYSERQLYSVPNDFEMIEPIQKGIDEGTMEIEYGNSLEEVIKKDSFYWYDNGVKYEMQVRNQDLPYSLMYDMARKIIDAE